MAPDETRAGPGVWCRSTDGAQLRWTEFHADGTAKRQSCGYAAGVPEGTFLAWHSNGKTWVQGQYTSGRKAGRWTQWDAFGAKVAEGEYRAGEFVAGAPVGVIAGCETRKP